MSAEQKKEAEILRKGHCLARSNPVKLCHEISRLTGARVRSVNLEGVMSQHSARLVMGVLAHCDKATQKEIVDQTHLRPPTVSVLLRKMQEEGMVELWQNPEDKRELLARLTEYGREVDGRVVLKIRETDRIALDGLSDGEQAVLMELLGKMRENLLCEKNEEERE